MNDNTQATTQAQPGADAQSAADALQTELDTLTARRATLEAQTATAAQAVAASRETLITSDDPEAAKQLAEQVAAHHALLEVDSDLESRIERAREALAARNEEIHRAELLETVCACAEQRAEVRNVAQREAWQRLNDAIEAGVLEIIALDEEEKEITTTGNRVLRELVGAVHHSNPPSDDTKVRLKSLLEEMRAAGCAQPHLAFQTGNHRLWLSDALDDLSYDHEAVKYGATIRKCIQRAWGIVERRDSATGPAAQPTAPAQSAPAVVVDANGNRDYVGEFLAKTPN